jgi:hypothetical protein
VDGGEDTGGDREKWKKRMFKEVQYTVFQAILAIYLYNEGVIIDNTYKGQCIES